MVEIEELPPPPSSCLQHAKNQTKETQRLRLTTLLLTIKSSLPTPHEQQAFETQIQPKLIQEFDHPKTSICNVLHELTGERALSDVEYRCVLFWPLDVIHDHNNEKEKEKENGVKYYAKLLSPHLNSVTNKCSLDEDGDDIIHPLQIPFMVLTLLLHTCCTLKSEAKNSFEFSQLFIIGSPTSHLNPLNTLVSLLTHTSPSLRSQALTILQNLTSHPGFDFFDVIPHDLLSFERKWKLDVHGVFLDLAHTSYFLDQLLNSINTPVPSDSELSGSKTYFPGNTNLTFQILIWYISWLRALHTPNNHLKISKRLVKVFELYTSKSKVWDRDESGLDIRYGEITIDERELAIKVSGDFGQCLMEDEKEEDRYLVGMTENVDRDFVGAVSKAGADDKSAVAKSVKSAFRLPSDAPRYIKSDVYNGAKEGYVFKSGEDGVGYYIDIYKTNDAATSEFPKLPEFKESKNQIECESTPNTPEANEKVKGNNAFNEGRYEDALDCYGRALNFMAVGEFGDLDDDGNDNGNDNGDGDEPSFTVIEDDERNKLKSVLHLNRATCYLKLLRGQSTFELPLSVNCMRTLQSTPMSLSLESLKMLKVEAETSITLTPNNAKSHYRLSQYHALTSSLRDSSESCRTASTLANASDKKLKNEIDYFNGVLLTLVYEDKGKVGAGDGKVGVMSALDREAAIMNKILGRRGYGVKVYEDVEVKVEVEVEVKEVEVEVGNDSQMVVIDKKKKQKIKRTKYGDDPTSSESDSNNNNSSEYKEITANSSDSDDDSHLTRATLKLARQKLKSERLEVKQVQDEWVNGGGIGVVEDVVFVDTKSKGSKIGMDDILGLRMNSKIEKRKTKTKEKVSGKSGDKKTKSKSKENEGLKEIRRMMNKKNTLTSGELE